jgi:hypothetical protein
VSQTIKVDKAERAVFKALYPIPVENNNVSKLRSSLKHGENGLMFLSQQYVSIVLRYLLQLWPISNLSLKDLTIKYVMLLALTTGQRAQSIHFN